MGRKMFQGTGIGTRFWELSISSRHWALSTEYELKSYLEMNEVRDVEKDPHCQAAQAVGRAERRNTCFLISTMNC